jgi:peptidyl-prolyl cis-trans isomerase D
MAKAKVTKVVSRKHLARLERERRQTIAISITAIVIILAVVLLIGYGILKETVLLARQPIVTVNGDSVNLREFQVRVRVTRQRYIDQYMQYVQFAQMLGIDPTTDQSLSNTLNQIQTQLGTPSTIGGTVLQDITDDLLIRQYAKANGITVSAQDVEDMIRSTFGFNPDGTPTPTITPTAVEFSTLSAEQLALITPTRPATLAPTRTPAPTITLDLTSTATLVPSPTETATPYTLEGFQKRYQDALDYYSKLGMTEADFRKIYFESNLYRQRVSAVITADVPHTQEQVWARHILVADQITANNIYQELLAGADFATLATQNSIDTGSKNSGGDLGWFGKGKMVAEFEAAAFAQPIGVIGTPVQSANGWHIIQVLGHEMRPLTASEYTDATNKAFTDWLSSQRSSANVVINSIWTANTPDKPDLQTAFNDMYATETAYAPTNPPQVTP